MKAEDLLRAAVDDNLAWCRAVCAAHGAVDEMSPAAWFNLRPSPRYYPNLVTRRPGAAADIGVAIGRLRAVLPEGWGLKDSFADCDLGPLGFEPLLAGHWYGGHPAAPAAPPAGWTRVGTPDDLAAWEVAWGGDPDRRIFPAALLADPRLTFWSRQAAGGIVAGCVAFHHDGVIGLSNWFAATLSGAADTGSHQEGTPNQEPDEAATLSLALAAVCGRWPDAAVVFWSSEAVEVPGIRRLGPLRVWRSRR